MRSSGLAVLWGNSDQDSQGLEASLEPLPARPHLQQPVSQELPPWIGPWQHSPFQKPSLEHRSFWGPF